MSISVLISTYNSGKYISQTIRSILNQTFSDFELIIIDDGSEDNTEDMVFHNFQDQRIIYFKKEHTGNADSLNWGLSKCKYELVAKLDSDDIATQNRLYLQFKYLTDNPQIDVISGSVAFFEGRKIRYVITNPVSNYEIKKKLLVHSCISHSGVMYKKSLVLNAGGYSNILLEDYDLWLKLYDKAIFCNLSEVITLARLRIDSTTSKHRKDINKHHLKISTDYIASHYLHFENPAFKINNNIILLEFYYGNFKLGRVYYRKSFTANYLFSKLTIIYILSILPFKFLDTLLVRKIIPRTKYYLSYFSKGYSLAREVLSGYTKE